MRPDEQRAGSHGPGPNAISYTLVTRRKPRGAKLSYAQASRPFSARRPMSCRSVLPSN